MNEHSTKYLIKNDENQGDQFKPQTKQYSFDLDKSAEVFF